MPPKVAINASTSPISLMKDSKRTFIVSGYSYFTSRISYRFTPPGVCTSATSPDSLPISARAIGEPIEILPCLDVRLVLADDLVGRRSRRCRVLERRRSRRTRSGRRRRAAGIDDLGVGELRLELGDAALDEALAPRGGVVLGVFREVAVRARLRDRRDDRRALDGLQLLQLGAQQLGAARGHRCLCSCRAPWRIAVARAGPAAGRARSSVEVLHAGAGRARAGERGVVGHALRERGAADRARIRIDRGARPRRC